MTPAASDQTWAVTYTSRATRPMTALELQALLINARTFNRQAGVTGVLLHRDGAFFQYFEGLREGVDAVYARIKASPLHRGLIELMHQPVPARQFAQWYMAFAGAPETVLQDLSNEQWAWVVSNMQRDLPSPGLHSLMQFWNAEGAVQNARD